MDLLSNLAPAIWMQVKKSWSTISGQPLRLSDDRYVLTQIDAQMPRAPRFTWGSRSNDGRMISEESMRLIRDFLLEKYIGQQASECLVAAITSEGDDILHDAGFPYIRMSVEIDFDRALIDFHRR